MFFKSSSCSSGRRVGSLVFDKHCLTCLRFNVFSIDVVGPWTQGVLFVAALLPRFNNVCGKNEYKVQESFIKNNQANVDSTSMAAAVLRWSFVRATSASM
jgi:hypothetical protein